MLSEKLKPVDCVHEIAEKHKRSPNVAIVAVSALHKRTLESTPQSEIHDKKETW